MKDKRKMTSMGLWGYLPIRVFLASEKTCHLIKSVYRKKNIIQYNGFESENNNSYLTEAIKKCSKWK